MPVTRSIDASELPSRWSSVYSFKLPYWKEILLLAGPVVGAMLAQALVNQADSIMVGRLPAVDGVPGQSAVGLTTKILWAFGGFLSAIAIGTQALTARRMGENNPKTAGAVLMNSLLVAFVTSGIASVLGFVYGPTLLSLISGDNPEIMRVGGPFIQWRLLGIITMVVTTTYKAFFDGLGRTYVHFVASIIMNATNILLNYMLIYGKLGAPYLGVRGAAIASVLSTVVGLAIMVVFSLQPKLIRNHHHYTLHAWSATLMKQVVKLSLPSGVATLLLMTGFLIVDWIVSGIGTGSERTFIQTSHQIVITILMPALITCLAFGTATATLVSRSLGEKEYRKAEIYAWDSVKIWGFVMLGIGIWIAATPAFWIRIFNPHEPALVAVAGPALRMLGTLLPLVALGVILMQAHYGAGNTMFVMSVEFGNQFFVLVPGTYLMGRVLNQGLMGVWIAIIFYLLMISGFMSVTFFRGKWKCIRI